MQAGDYSATETLRDGRPVEIRALRPEDRTGLLAAVGRTSAQSLYRRFFAFKHSFMDQEIDFYLNVDFEGHVALVALLVEDSRPVIVGGCRYVVVQPGQAEVAFAVDVAHQGQGVGTVLMRHLVVIARSAGLKKLIADILPENTAMLKIFRASGLSHKAEREPDATHLVLRLSSDQGPACPSHKPPWQGAFLQTTLSGHCPEMTPREVGQRSRSLTRTSRDHLIVGLDAGPTDTGANGRFWHFSEAALWSAHEAVSGPSFDLMFVSL